MTVDEIRKSLANESDALNAIDTNTPEGQRAFWSQYEKIRVCIFNIMPYIRSTLISAALQEALNMIENQMKPEALKGDAQMFKYIRDTLMYHTERFH